MSDGEPESLVLRYLRAIDGKVDRIAEDLHDVKLRLNSVEEGLTGVRREITHLYEAQTRMQHTLDRHGDRLERVERRLELLPA